MSIASEIQRLQGVRANIFDAITNKGVSVPSGAKLADCPELIEAISGGGCDEDTIEIQGFLYRYVKIGNLLWLKDNLRIPVGNKNPTSGQQYLAGYRYFIKKSVEQTGYGCYYNNLAIDGVESNLPQGWRIPTEQDVNDLKTAVGNDILSLKYPLGWDDTYNSYTNNSSKFDALPTGYMQSSTNGTVINYNNDKHFWLKYNTYNKTPYARLQTNALDIYNDDYNAMRPCIACKNA